uniref:hypothetical protein 43 n=1 Tax=Moniliophthora perniciosa TaxID=153609 RepID=UPI0000242338|nr:hypothetical protein 43 [Moniliophthora perniciosa]AAQ74330.1 hypothetical protein 43 [Moniliophthora perniciosa]
MHAPLSEGSCSYLNRPLLRTAVPSLCCAAKRSRGKRSISSPASCFLMPPSVACYACREQEQQKRRSSACSYPHAGARERKHFLPSLFPSLATYASQEGGEAEQGACSFCLRSRCKGSAPFARKGESAAWYSRKEREATKKKEKKRKEKKRKEKS